MPRSCTGVNSYSPPPPQVTADRVVETEFEAAEVLASLFNSTPPPSSREASVGGGGGAGESVDSWGSRSKRSSTLRVKSESSPLDSSLNSVSVKVSEEEKEKKPVLLAFDLNEDQATTFNSEEECQREPKDVVKADDVEMAELSPACATSQIGGKSRLNSSEPEKEARRLRRVLANRESARQTIRRRQALYEDLTRKVADLVQENENLKKEKESAVEVYQALKCTNKKLNEQVVEQLESKVEEDLGKSTSANCSVPALPFSHCPYIVCKDKAFVYPYNIQLPDAYPPQLGHYGFAEQPEAKLCETINSEPPNGKGQPLSVTGPSGQWCMVPYPLVFPMPDVNNGPNLIPFFPAEDGGNEAGIDNQDAGTSSSKVVFCSEKLPSEYPVDVKTEFTTSVEAQLGKASHEVPFGLPLDAVDLQLRSQSNQVEENSSIQSCKIQSDGREAMGVIPTNDVNAGVISSKGIHDAKVLQESHQELGLKHGKRLVDPAVAAEARKRRKELTRLKSLHCRAHRKEGMRLGDSHHSMSRNA